jgi:predicted  nucleic acid-binding Zn-ribbon protein
MSDSPSDFDLREQIVRIDRAIAETRKLMAEQDKLAEEALKLRREQALDFDRATAETRKLMAEQDKLTEETLKLRREQAAYFDRTIAETRKFMAEQNKLAEEALNLRRERWWQPALAVSGLVGGLVAIATLILHAVGRT